jgi:phage-related protein
MREVATDLQTRLEEDTVRLANLLVIVLDETTLYVTDHDQQVPFFDEADIPQVFMPVPFKVGQIETNSDGKFSQVNLSLDNVTREFSLMMRSIDFEGRKAMIWKICLDELDDPANKIKFFEGFIDKPDINEAKFQVTILSAPEVMRYRIPYRLYRRTCPWVFGSTQCPYPSPVGKVCNKTFANCGSYGMTIYFGGFRKLPVTQDVRGMNG